MQVQKTISVLGQHDYEDSMDSKLSLMSSKAMETRYYEGCGREGPIRCIFLGEFHPVAGPKISCQFPEDYISKEVFDSISAYIIPKPLIQKCTMTINALGHKIVGYPIRIDNSRYERNVYVFNLCFVCDSWSKTVQYEPVVKKLGEHLTIMEEATRFVSSGSSKLPTLLAHLLHDLNTHRKATIVDDFQENLNDVQTVETRHSPFISEVPRTGRNTSKRRRKKKRKKQEKEKCRPRTRSQSRTPSPSASPSLLASGSGCRSRSPHRRQQVTPKSHPTPTSDKSPTAERKSRSRSPRTLSPSKIPMPP